MISPTLTALLKRSSFLSRIAYEPPHIAAPILTRWGAEYTPFECIETDTQGFALVEDGELWFTFRGTEFEAGPNTGKWRDVKTDLNAWPDDGVHRGVKEAVDSVWADIDSTLGKYAQVKEIRFDGHSLGGGCAEEASDRAVYNGHKDVTCITFGAPRIFTPWHRSMDAGSLYRFRKVSVGVCLLLLYTSTTTIPMCFSIVSASPFLTHLGARSQRIGLWGDSVRCGTG
jgi:hypothetical protein